MKTKLMALTLGVLTLFIMSPSTWALPVGPYDAMVSSASSYTTPSMLIGDRLYFDYWTELAQPATSRSWDVMAGQINGTWEFLGQISFNSTSTSWAPYSFDIPTSLEGKIDR